MTLNKIFADSGEFMDWLAHNCYSSAEFGNGSIQHNPDCELESIISHAALNEEFDDNLSQMIIENGKLCKCKNLRSLN